MGSVTASKVSKGPISGCDGNRGRLTSYEEISGRLTVGGLVAHVDEVLARLVRGAHVHLQAVIDDTDLVKVLIELLSRLVDRDDGRLTEDIRGYPQSLHELKGSRSTGKDSSGLDRAK